MAQRDEEGCAEILYCGRQTGRVLQTTCYQQSQPLAVRILLETRNKHLLFISLFMITYRSFAIVRQYNFRGWNRFVKYLYKKRAVAMLVAERWIIRMQLCWYLSFAKIGPLVSIGVQTSWAMDV